VSSDPGDRHTAIDPVCGMAVDPQTAAQRSEWRGQTVYFCCDGCKRAFDRKPSLYEVRS
jgi:YHS domain-containing protein